MSNALNNTLKAVGLSVAVATISVPTQADDLSTTTTGNRETRSAIVVYGDLDLSTQAGIKTLHGRLRTASRAVCASSSDDTRDLSVYQDYVQCLRVCRKAVMDKVGAAAIADARLSRTHLAQTGRSAAFVQLVAGSN